MPNIDPTQVITIGGFAAVVFAGLIGFLTWYIKQNNAERKRNEGERNQRNDELKKIVERNSAVMEGVSQSQDRNTQATMKLSETVTDLKGAVKTQADYASLVVEVIRARDKKGGDTK